LLARKRLLLLMVGGVVVAMTVRAAAMRKMMVVAFLMVVGGNGVMVGGEECLYTNGKARHACMNTMEMPKSVHLHGKSLECRAGVCGASSVWA
jgi:hypothetical protein